MVKFTILFRRNERENEIREVLYSSYIPGAKKFKGVQSFEVTELTVNPLAALAGDEVETPYFMEVCLYFNSPEALEETLADQYTLQVSEQLLSIAGDTVTVMIGNSKVSNKGELAELQNERVLEEYKLSRLEK
ncbi:EthD domain-containing protein [Risungbinella massiliensis]|uniref:hypothetical protein n=1 Tax=Risungbinella massiliensis TaxID=1329796 RepID=UPI0005CBC494|nr:hypothetical protein [Risungbinella massiliensis]